MGPAVLLWGGACSGKSTMYRILAAAYRGLRAEGGEDAYRQYPRVKTTVIHTKAHTLQEVGRVWSGGEAVWTVYDDVHFVTVHVQWNPSIKDTTGGPAVCPV